MANRIFVIGVVTLWLSSMTWLVKERILPSFFSGNPPIVQAYEDGEAVAWSVYWSGKVVGEAASVRLTGVGGSTDLYNRVVLNEFPVMELAPAWIRMTVGDLGKMTFDVKTRIEFDPLGRFSSFNSRVSLNDIASVLRISGRLEESHLELKARTSDFSHTKRIFLPNSEVLNEVLFPTAKLPYMHVGRSWQEKVYSPFSSPASPVELVHVEVVAVETMEHLGEVRRVFRVIYRSMEGSGVPANARVQGISWVDPESGDVLRRDIFFAGSKLRFERLPKKVAVEAGLKLFKDQLLLADPPQGEESSEEADSPLDAGADYGSDDVDLTMDELDPLQLLAN